MDILLKSGAELYSQDKYKMTCLHLAAARNHTNAVAMLLKYQVGKTLANCQQNETIPFPNLIDSKLN